MNYKIGNGELITQAERELNFQCPECGEKAVSGIFHNADFQLIAKFPLVDTKDVYFTICPHCKSTWYIEASDAKAFIHFEKDNIETSSFTKAEKYGNGR